MENSKVTTKIPLPRHPLPAIPKYLLTKKENQDKIRRPLKTLHQQNTNTNFPSASTSQKADQEADKMVNKKSNVLKIDSKHVTVRSATETLDWDYNIFKDRDESESDDSDETVSTKVIYFTGAKPKQNNCSEPRLATPAVKRPEHKSVRNVKRSLKRPHSRELQGLSPVATQHKRDERVKRRLQFNEPLNERLRSPDYWKQTYTRTLVRSYTEDIFQYLLCKEQKLVGVPKISTINRACVINWLMKVNGPDGNPATLQSACWYLDTILATGNVQLAKLQLVAAACYWISQKLYGPVVSSLKLARISGRAFSPENLVAAERIVLKRLKFPMQPVVPQEYITYLSWWCDNLHPGEIEVAATFLCVSGLMVDKSCILEFPSVVAAAAVRSALLLLQKKHLINDLQLCPLYKEAEMKTMSIGHVSSMLHRAVCTISGPFYEYKTPYEHYGLAPGFIAQRIINAAFDLINDGLEEP